MSGYLEIYTEAELAELATDYKRALQAVGLGQSYTTSGGAQITRANLPEIKKILEDIAKEYRCRAGKSAPRVVGTRIRRVY